MSNTSRTPYVSDERDKALSALKSMEPVTYVRQGPPIQMQDVLLACGELNEREQVAVRWVLAKINALPPYTPPAPSELEEADAVDAILNFRAMRMTLHEAVKWLHDEHTENCNTLRAPIMKHRLGLGGERLAAIAANYIEQSESAKASQPSPWISVSKDQQPPNGCTVVYWHKPGPFSGKGWMAIADEWSWEDHGEYASHYLPASISLPPTPEQR